MKLTKEQILNYFIDVLGNSDEDGRKIYSLWGFNYLNDEQKQECFEFNQ